MTAIEIGLALPALMLALMLRPWRMFAGPGVTLLSPTAAALALLPWLGLLPHQLPQG